jgi:hypothetical protein
MYVKGSNVHMLDGTHVVGNTDRGQDQPRTHKDGASMMPEASMYNRTESHIAGPPDFVTQGGHDEYIQKEVESVRVSLYNNSVGGLSQCVHLDPGSMERGVPDLDKGLMFELSNNSFNEKNLVPEIEPLTLQFGGVSLKEKSRSSSRESNSLLDGMTAQRPQIASQCKEIDMVQAETAYIEEERAENDATIASQKEEIARLQVEIARLETGKTDQDAHNLKNNMESEDGVTHLKANSARMEEQTARSGKRSRSGKKDKSVKRDKRGKNPKLFDFRDVLKPSTLYPATMIQKTHAGKLRWWKS